MKEGATICRWRIGKVEVDIMPCSADILGFSNRWYRAAIENAVPVRLAAIEIKMISAPYFLATKIEAFIGRGNEDFLGSADMEDIITLIDGRQELIEEIRRSATELQHYLREIFQKWLQKKVFISSIPGHISAGPASKARAEEVNRRIQAMAQE